jgi:hypothetical protein
MQMLLSVVIYGIREESMKLSEKEHSVRSAGGTALNRFASLPLRAIVGFGFMQHGFAKLSKGPDAFAGILQVLHVPMPHLSG